MRQRVRHGNPRLRGVSAGVMPRLDAQRVLDIAVSLTVLILASPLMAAIALAIRLDSAGVVIFAQERIGLHCRPFRCFKFRTMTDRCDDAWWTVPGDTRVTRVGRILRRTHLDELPQFWNVLRGDMSIVGPRPLRLHVARELDCLEHPRWSVRPGITGWAQISRGYPVTAEEQREKFGLDQQYVEGRSFWVDLRIILWTVWIMFRLRGL